MRRLRFLALLIGAIACGDASKRTLDVSWKGPPITSPGDEARSGDQAEPRLEALHDAPPTPGPTPSELDRAADLSREANERRTAGDLDGALQRQQAALAIRERVLGPDDAAVAATLTSIAAIHAEQDDYAAAEPLLQRALAIREHALGGNHRLTAHSLNNLALLYAAEGRYPDAEPLYQRAVVIFETTHASADLATTLENYAALLDETDRADEAAQLQNRARLLHDLDVRKGVTGDQ